MEVFIPVLISVTATLGLIALGVSWIVIAPVSSHADDQDVAQGMNTIRIRPSGVKVKMGIERQNCVSPSKNGL